ncbi:MAG: DNA polymerase III subunit beta [Actinomycetaceae bacterium]|nr:DNA polymerase III subunit beta [Actinomycetaceae bacterium]
MKFRVEKEVLSEAVSWAARTLPTRPAVPVLAGVHITASPTSGLEISSFDYEVSGKVVVDAQVENEGQVVVSGRLLAEICRSLPNRPVDVEHDEQKLVIKCGASSFSLPSMPIDDYPPLPSFPEFKGVVDANVLGHAVNQVSIAASRDDTLPLLTSVRMEMVGSIISLLATDRYRLALREIEWDPSLQDLDIKALVKAKTLQDVAKSMTTSGPVNIALETQGMAIIGFEAGGRTVTSQLNDGDYPDVRKLFPDVSTTYVVVSTSELSDSVKRVSLVAAHNNQIRLTISEGNISLEAGQGEDAHAVENIPCHLEGPDITTAFNSRYLLDGLSALDTNYVRLSFTDSARPAIITGQAEIGGSDQQDFKYLLMPIRFGI